MTPVVADAFGLSETAKRKLEEVSCEQAFSASFAKAFSDLFARARPEVVVQIADLAHTRVHAYDESSVIIEAVKKELAERFQHAEETRHCEVCAWLYGRGHGDWVFKKTCGNLMLHCEKDV